MALGFQSGAFQQTAFQSATATGVPGYGGSVRKRKFVVRKDGRLLVFSNAADAMAMATATDEPQEVERAPEKPKARILRKIEAKAEEQIPLEYVQEIAQARGEVEAVNRLLAEAHYMALMALVRQMQDEEDVEMLLLSA